MDTVIVRFSVDIECDNVRKVSETINNREFETYADLTRVIADELNNDDLEGVLIHSLNEFIECANDNIVWLDNEFIAQCRVGDSSYKQEQEAKDFLRSKGYFVDNLWQVADVQGKFNCTDEEAQEILEEALTNDCTMEQIWFAIDDLGYHAGLQRVAEESEEETEE